MKNGVLKIKNKYKILPYLIEFKIPGFLKHYKEGIYTLSVSPKNSEKQFFELVDRIVYSIDNKIYLPIVRLSDGEYNFLLNDQPPVRRNSSVLNYIIKYIIYLKNKSFRSYEASTRKGVSSGSYSKKQRDDKVFLYSKQLSEIADKGILAMHLTFSLKPFQEKFHPALKTWLDFNQITITEKNYTPFYFVYALLRGKVALKIFKNRHILVVHSAYDEKQHAIVRSLKQLGCRKVSWKHISVSNSMYDVMSIVEDNDIDLVLVGAGVGKPNIIVQLEPLSVPVIDAGYTFEVWADIENKWERALMVPDIEWDSRKINF